MKTKLLIILAMVAGIALSCNSDYKGYKKSKSGLYYKVITDGKSEIKPDSNDVVTIRLKYFSYANDSLLYDSETMLNGPVRVIIAPKFKGDIFEGMMMMGAGDSMSFLVRADSLAKYEMLPHSQDTLGMIRFEVKMDSIQRYADYMAEQELYNQQQEAELAELESMEKEDFQSYLDKNPGFAGPKGGGYYIKVTKAGSGSEMKEGLTAILDFECTLINGVEVASTKNRGKEMEYAMGSRSFFADWDEALSELRKGGEATILLPSSMGLGKQGGGNGLVPPFASLIFKVKVIDVLKAEEIAARKAKEEARMLAAEKAEIAKYLKANNITAKPTASGLIYIPKIEGKGAQASPGSTVKVHYTGKLLSGVVFDSSVDTGEPLSFVIGKQQVIEGWDEGIAMMKQGGEATLIVPSNIGYGSSGAGNHIKPYSPLVFDVKLIEVK